MLGGIVMDGYGTIFAAETQLTDQQNLDCGCLNAIWQIQPYAASPGNNPVEYLDTDFVEMNTLSGFAITPADTSTPPPPTGVTVSTGDGSATLHWTAPANTSVTGYVVTPYIGAVGADARSRAELADERDARSHERNDVHVPRDGHEPVRFQHRGDLAAARHRQSGAAHCGEGLVGLDHDDGGSVVGVVHAGSGQRLRNHLVHRGLYLGERRGDTGCHRRGGSVHAGRRDDGRDVLLHGQGHERARCRRAVGGIAAGDRR